MRNAPWAVEVRQERGSTGGQAQDEAHLTAQGRPGLSLETLEAEDNLAAG